MVSGIWANGYCFNSGALILKNKNGRKMPSTRCLIAKIVRIFVIPSALISSQMVFPAEESPNTEGGVTLLPELLDAERSFQIAKEAAKAGDYQKAIVALERVLLINPSLGNIKYELALLYRKVGALTRSKYYLQEALKDPSMPSNIRERATSELAALSGEAVVARGEFFSSLTLGLQHDSNALGESEIKQLNQGVALGGISFARTDEEFLGSDVSANVILNGGYRSRVGHDGSSLWTSTLQLGLSRYAEFEDENDSYARFRTGITVPFAARGQSFAPFFQISKPLDENDDPTFAVGTTLRNGGSNYLSEVTFQTAESDDEYTTSVSGSLRFSQSTTFSNNFGFSISNANAPTQSGSSNAFGISYTASKRFGALALNTPAVVSLSVSSSIKHYAEPDLLLDPDEARVDEVTSVSLTGNAQVSKNLSVALGARYSDNRSNIENYKFDNFQFSTSATWRF